MTSKLGLLSQTAQTRVFFLGVCSAIKADLHPWGSQESYRMA